MSPKFVQLDLINCTCRRLTPVTAAILLLSSFLTNLRVIVSLMAGLRGRGILTKNRAGKGGGAGDGSDYILQLRISVLEQVVMHSYHIDGEGSLAGWSLFSLNFEVSWPFQGPRRPFCKRQ